MLKEGVDFNYVIPEDESTTVGIKLLTGKYADTVYNYGKVKFEPGDSGEMYLKFVFAISETPLDKEKLEKDIDFKNYIGDVLTQIMSANMDKGIVDEIGTNYSEELDSE